MGSLHAKLVARDGVTFLEDSRFTAPLKIAKPFYRGDGSGKYTEIMVMSASAGMLDGDAYDLSFDFGENASGMITSQSYTKIFQAREKGARQTVTIRAGARAAVCHLPAPVIPFAGSRFDSRTDIYLESTSKLFLCDIFACGRVGMGERFLFDRYAARTAVHVGGRLVFLDHAKLLPREADLGGIGFFEGRTHQGLIYIFGYSSHGLGVDGSALPESSPDGWPDLEVAASQAEQGIVIRLLGGSGEAIAEYAHRLLHQLRRQGNL